MKGTTRLGVSDSNAEQNDSAFQSKRIMARSPFDFHRAEPSQQPLMAAAATPPLDMQRAESSRQHVRALNTQFASWVQAQLQNHPDELWEDGVKDYLAHASIIMEKFSDVVNWLKANSAKGESTLAVGLHIAEKKLVPESKSNETKVFQEKTGLVPAGPTTNFASAWNSRVLSISQPVLFGSQNPVPINNGASNDVDDENDVEQPSSPSVKKIDEKGIIVVHEVKCKLYVKSSDPAEQGAWKDRGTGQLSIKCKEGVSRGTKESKPTIIVRNDAYHNPAVDLVHLGKVGKLLLNALLYPGIKTNLQKNSLVAIFHTLDDAAGNDGSNGDVVARTFLIRTKTEEDRNKLAAAIQEYAPAA